MTSVPTQCTAQGPRRRRCGHIALVEGLCLRHATRAGIQPARPIEPPPNPRAIEAPPRAKGNDR